MTPELAEPSTRETPPLAESPGQLVKRTRERAGLSLEDLAGQIKLSKTTLDALERDDFAQLGQPVYVRGYYRKCAKVLPLAESDLIAGYEARVKPTAPTTPQRIPLAGGVSSGTAGGPPRRALAVVVSVGAVLGLMYWVSNHPTNRFGTPVSVSPVTQVTEVPLAQDTDVAASPAAEAPAPTPAPTAAPAARSTPAPAPAAAEAREAESAAVAATPVISPKQLSLLFDEASWVRVEDSRNKTLLIGLVRAGEKQDLKGEPPYTVFVGNARKVRAEFGGKPFDFGNHIQSNDTARFTVP